METSQFTSSLTFFLKFDAFNFLLVFFLHFCADSVVFPHSVALMLKNESDRICQLCMGRVETCCVCYQEWWAGCPRTRSLLLWKRWDRWSVLTGKTWLIGKMWNQCSRFSLKGPLTWKQKMTDFNAPYQGQTMHVWIKYCYFRYINPYNHSCFCPRLHLSSPEPLTHTLPPWGMIEKPQMNFSLQPTYDLWTCRACCFAIRGTLRFRHLSTFRLKCLPRNCVESHS